MHGISVAAGQCGVPHLQCLSSAGREYELGPLASKIARESLAQALRQRRTGFTHCPTGPAGVGTKPQTTRLANLDLERATQAKRCMPRALNCDTAPIFAAEASCAPAHKETPGTMLCRVAPAPRAGSPINVSDVFLSDLWSFHKALSRRLQHTWLAPVIQTTLPAKAPGGAGPFHQSLRSTSAL